MTGKFKKFIERKNFEMENMMDSSINFDSAAMMGTKPITSRQPAFVHAVLNGLERSIGITSKAEIIFEALKDSLSVYMESLTDYERAMFLAKLNLEMNYLSNEMTSSNQPEHTIDSFKKNLSRDYDYEFSDSDIDNIMSFYCSLSGGDK